MYVCVERDDTPLGGGGWGVEENVGVLSPKDPLSWLVFGL